MKKLQTYYNPESTKVIKDAIKRENYYEVRRDIFCMAMQSILGINDANEPKSFREECDHKDLLKCKK